MRRITLLSILLLSSCCLAQHLTTITGTIKYPGGISINGTVCATGTDTKDVPQSFLGTSWARSTDPGCSGASVAVVNGAIQSGLIVEDTAYTKPAGVCYRLQVFDSSGQQVLRFKCAQPTGNVWDIGNYNPDFTSIGLPPDGIVWNLTVKNNATIGNTLTSSIIETPTFYLQNAATGCLQADATGLVSATGQNCNLVTSVAGRTGAVTLSASDISGLATVAITGSYNDLTNKPAIPAAQVNADWTATSGVAQILNKPALATVATSGNYADLSGLPTIPTKTSQLTNDAGFLSTIPASGVTAGSYTNANITVTADGRITSASTGSPGGITAINGVITASGAGTVTSTFTNGTTGSGSIVLSTSPTLTSPNIGAAIGSTLSLAGLFTSNGGLSLRSSGWYVDTGGENSVWPGNVSGANSVAGITYTGSSGSQLFTLSSAPGQTSLQLDGSVFVGEAMGASPFGWTAANAGNLAVGGSAGIVGQLMLSGSGTAVNSKGILLGSLGDPINTNVASVGDEVGQFEIAFAGWRDVEPYQIGAKIAAIRTNNYQPNSALIQATDLAFFTGGGATGNNGTLHDTSSDRMHIFGSSGDVAIGTTQDTGSVLYINGKSSGTTGTLFVQANSGFQGYSISTNGSGYFGAGVASGGVVAGSGFAINGAAQGITATKTAGSCTFTINGGIILGVSGC